MYSVQRIAYMHNSAAYTLYTLYIQDTRCVHMHSRQYTLSSLYAQYMHVYARPACILHIHPIYALCVVYTATLPTLYAYTILHTVHTAHCMYTAYTACTLRAYMALCTLYTDYMRTICALYAHCMRSLHCTRLHTTGVNAPGTYTVNAYIQYSTHIYRK